MSLHLSDIGHVLVMLQVIEGNSNTYLGSKRELDPPVWASRIRFVPYSYHRRTVCMRVEMYGCYWNGTLLCAAHVTVRHHKETRDRPACHFSSVSLSQCHLASWLKWRLLWLTFGSSPIRISAEVQTVLAEFCLGFPQSLQINVRKLASSLHVHRTW
jgi:hypothetical protein